MNPAVLVVALVVANAFSSVPSAFYQQLAPATGLTPTATTAMLFAVHGVAAILAMGAVAARPPRWRIGTVLAVLLGADALAGAILVAAGGPTEVAALTVGRALTGAALGAITVTATAALAPLRRGSALATAGILGGVGLGAVLSGLVVSTGITRGGVFLAGVLLLATVALVVALTPTTELPVGAPRERSTPGPVVIVAAGIAFAANGMLGLFTSVLPGVVALDGSALVAGLSAGTALLAAGLARLAVPASWGVRARILGAGALIAGGALFAVGLVNATPGAAIAGGTLLGFGSGIAYSVALDLARRAEPGLRMLAHVQRGGQLGLVIPVLLFPFAAQR